MKNIIIGNGIHLQFGGKDEYSVSAITKRMEANLARKKYGTPIFENQILDESILQILSYFVQYYNKGLEGAFDTLFLESYKQQALATWRGREKVSCLYEIPFEEWFLILEIICKKANFSMGMCIDMQEGFRRMILDAIYHDGKIQEVPIPMFFVEFLNQFDSVFTVNYDKNLERLTTQHIYHIHGDFETLANPHPEKMACGFEHCFCNATMSYSGFIKQIHTVIDQEKYSVYDKLKTVAGDVYILGMSPTNDSHIIDAIKNNAKITKVICCFATSQEATVFEELFQDNNIELVDVFEFWEMLKSK